MKRIYLIAALAAILISTAAVAQPAHPCSCNDSSKGAVSGPNASRAAPQPLRQDEKSTGGQNVRNGNASNPYGQNGCSSCGRPGGPKNNGK